MKLQSISFRYGKVVGNRIVEVGVNPKITNILNKNTQTTYIEMLNVLYNQIFRYHSM